MDNHQEEIKKVLRKIPKWFKKTDQLNSKILRGFMTLSNSSEISIYPSVLEEYCIGHYNNVSRNQFKTNFNQMKTKSKKNHAKVFEKNLDGSISLWEPVADFIITEYKKIHQ